MEATLEEKVGICPRPWEVGYIVGMKVATKQTSAVAKAGDEEALFVRFFGQAVNGLLAGNARYDDGSLSVQEVYAPEELIERGVWMAEKMVKMVEARREVERFEIATGTNDED